MTTFYFLLNWPINLKIDKSKNRLTENPISQEINLINRKIKNIFNV